LSAARATSLIFYFTTQEGLRAFQEIGFAKLLTRTVWRPGREQYGILAMIAGSICVTIGAIILGVPLALGGAIFLAEVAPDWIRNIVRPAVELLAGIPSVVNLEFLLTPPGAVSPPRAASPPPPSPHSTW
jgi:phosphate transport system permease protein